MSKEFERSPRGEHIKGIFKDKDKRKDEAINIPSKLLHQIVAKLGINNIEHWNTLVDHFNRSPLSKSSKSPKDISQERSNFNRQVWNFRTTWANFWKALQILLPVHIEIEVKLGWRNGLWTIDRFASHNRLSKLEGSDKLDPARGLTRDMLTEEEKALTDEKAKSKK